MNERVLEKALTLRLSDLENPEFQDKMSQARKCASRGPLSVVDGIFGIAQAFVGLAAFGALLVQLGAAPWLTRLETISAETVWAAASDVPPQWYGGDLGEMEALVEKLLVRRSRIRELIEMFGNSDRRPFPKWMDGQKKVVGGWQEGKWGSTIGRVN